MSILEAQVEIRKLLDLLEVEQDKCDEAHENGLSTLDIDSEIEYLVSEIDVWQAHIEHIEVTEWENKHET
jgi:hypothetical protein